MFRKKPVVIEARQWQPDDLLAAGDVVGWVGVNGGSVRVVDGNRLEVATLEGRIYASAGDWVIRGVQGEFYPCKPDIFDATYEAAS